MRPSALLAWGVAGWLGAASWAWAGQEAPAAGQTTALAAAVEEAVRDAIATDRLPGAVVVVGRDERVLYRGAIGWRALVPSREPLTPDTIFDLASLTKPVATAPLVMALWEEGRLDLDAPVGRYLTEFRSSAWKEVTLRRLLLHAGGVPEAERPRPGPRPLSALLHELARRGPVLRPGSEFDYADAGFILLGEVVHRVTGTPLDEVARRRLFEALGMRDTTFRPPAAWRPRIAPTTLAGDHVLRGEVHDPVARALGGVAGHAGLFSTVDDLARFCRMLLADGTLDGRRVLAPATVQVMLEGQRIGEVTRALGWDVASPYSRTLGAFFPPGSVGHTGFTGSALWLDRPSETYVIVLTSRVHPDGQGQVADLRRRVSAAVGAATFDREAPAVPRASPGAPSPDRSDPPVRTGLDRLIADRFRPLAGHTIALLTNQTGRDATGRRTIDHLAAAPDLRLQAVWTPEHGLDGRADAPVAHGRDESTGIRVWSLYGPGRRPTPEMLRGVDTVVVDLQDVGVRYYTYLTTLVYVLEEAARSHRRVVVLDRPDPIGGRLVEGPAMDPDLRSFTGPHPLPVRTGLTMGEFARLVAGERRLTVDLQVEPLDGWHRSQWFDDTGLPWIDPSPNIRSLKEALLYAGLGLLEGTNVSVGRGTTSPFEVVGAPWIHDPEALAATLNGLGLPGGRFEPARFTPTASTYAGQPLGGVRVVVTDREAFRPVRLGLAVARVLRERYREYRPAAIQDLLANRATIWAFLRGDPLARVWRWLDADEARFEARRAPYLLYR